MMKNSLDFSDLSIFAKDESIKEKSDEESMLNSIKKRTLNDYDKEIKSLKEENFDLKLRIYLLEEKLSGYEVELDKRDEKCKKKSNEEKKNSVYDFSSDYEEDDDESLNTTPCNLDSKYFSPGRNIYNDDRNRIQELKETIDSLTEKLNQKEIELEKNRTQFETFKSEIQKLKLKHDNDIFEKSREGLEIKFEQDLARILKEKNREYSLREQQYKRQLDQNEINLERLNGILNEKTIEIEHLKRQQIELAKKHKNESACQMEKLIAKENIINNLESNLNNCKNKNEVNNVNKLNSISIQQDKIKSLSFIETFQKHYQLILQDLETQLSIKEKLLQKYISAINDKDRQINKLIDNNLISNKETNKHNIDLLISQLQKSLADKEKTLNDHYLLLSQKDDLIVNLKLNLNRYSIDLSKANEIILQSDNKILTLYNEILYLDDTNKSLLSLIENKNRTNQDLMANHQLELSQKNNFIYKMKETIKSNATSRNESQELTKFYEEQLNDRDYTISELTAKLKKINEKASQNLNEDNKDIQLKLLQKNNIEMKNEISKMTSHLEDIQKQLNAKTNEYDIESEKFKKRLKEKDNTIRNLIFAAEEKDSTIIRLKSKPDSIFLTKNSTVRSFSKSNDHLDEINREETRRRKMQGLLKTVQEKNQQIEALKTEIADLKSKQNLNGSISDLNSSSSNSLTNNISQPSADSKSVKVLLELLEKEVEIFQKLNSKEANTDIQKNMQEIIKLRNELLKSSFVLKDFNNQKSNRFSPTISSSSSGNNLVSPHNELISDDHKSSIMSFLSPRSSENSSNTNWRLDSLPDSGVASEKSDIIRKSPTAQNKNISENVSRSTTSNSISSVQTNNILSPSSSYSSMGLCNNSKLFDLNFKNKSHDELVYLIQQINNENLSLKSKIENKTPKVTEMHNELSNVREKLEAAERLNDYLRKQIEIFHIAHGNNDLLLEMAHKLDLNKDELEQYKEKMARFQDLNDSLPGANRFSAIFNKNELINNDLPTRNIKFTVTTLENKLEELKLKYRWLQDMYDNSESACRYFAIKFNKYNSFLHFNSNKSLRRSLSSPDLRSLKSNFAEGKNEFGENHFKQLLKKYLDKESTSTLKFETDKTTKLSGNEYHKKLLYIYKCFKNLKANQKYLKQIFGDCLVETFEDKSCPVIEINGENPLQCIFSNAFQKFDDINKQLEKKDELIKSLQNKIDASENDNNLNIGSCKIIKEDDLNKLRDTIVKTKSYLNELKGKLQKSFINIMNEKIFCDIIEKSQQELNEADKSLKNSFKSSFKINEDLGDKNSEQNGLNLKLKKYKDEINRLKEKIKSQNKDIEEALKLLSETNREKENIKLYLTNATLNENPFPKYENNFRENHDYLNEKLLKSHLKLNKAIDNIEKKLKC